MCYNCIHRWLVYIQLNEWLKLILKDESQNGNPKKKKHFFIKFSLPPTISCIIGVTHTLNI